MVRTTGTFKYRFIQLPYKERFKILLFGTDPCKKCILQGSCTEICDPRKKYNTAMDPSPFGNRLLAWILVCIVFIEIPWIFFTIITK